MNNIIYNFRVNAQSSDYEYRIYEAIETAKQYGLIETTLPDGKDFTLIMYSKPRFFNTKKGEKDVYDIFTQFLHIHVSYGEKETIYSIRIKKLGENWVIPYKNNAFDFSHPTNQTFEVYIWYKVPVLNITMASDHIYTHGNWDKMVFTSMRDFFNSIKGETDLQNFNNEYKHFSKWKKKLKAKK